jgi:lactate permease
LFPIGLVIFAALFTYATTETSGAIADIKGGLCSLSSDSRFLALLVAWGFGNFMEGMAGFGTAVAIPCAILVGVGFDPARAVLCCLVANSTPTAFGSVGVPTSVLASETGLDVGVLTSSIVLLQLAVTALLPFFVLVAADGWRGLRECWKLALGASIALVVPWCLAARFTGCELPDIVGGIAVMALFAFLGKRGETNVRRQLWAWMPFAFVVVALGAVSMMPAEHCSVNIPSLSHYCPVFCRTSSCGIHAGFTLTAWPSSITYPCFQKSTGRSWKTLCAVQQTVVST